MSGPETLYFFFDEQDRCLNVIDGIIIPSTTPRPLEYAPSGWQDISIQNQRNQKYFALDRSFTIPLEFVEDGAQILKDRYYNKGIEEKVFLVIMKQQLYFSDTEYGYYYTLLYRGEIDFSQLKHKGEKVTVNIMEGGASKYVKANETVKYPIPVDADPEAIKIKMDGIELQNSANFLLSAENHPPGSSGVIPMAYVRSEGTLLDVELNSAFIGWRTGQPLPYDVDNPFGGHPGQDDENRWFMRNPSSKDIRIDFGGSKLLINTQYDSGIGKGFSISVLKYDTSLSDNNADNNYKEALCIFTENNTANSRNTITECNLSGSLILKPGQRLRLIYVYQANYQWADGGSFVPITGGGNFIGNRIYFTESYFYARSFSRYRTTYIKALRPKRLYDKLGGKISDGTLQTESVALDTYKTFSVTCGDAIRGITGSEIKTSLSDFFQSFNPILSIGMGVVNGKLKLERKPDWIDNTHTIDLGEGKELIVSTALDYIFNSLKIGYPNQDYEDVNGKQEFNTTHIYTAPVTRVNKELDLTSVYRADCYGIEFTRINLEGKTTTDDSADNDVFVIHIKDTPIIDPVEGEVYELDRSLNQYASGLLTPETVFNLALSPKQCLLRNGQYLRSCFYKQDTGYLKFQTTDKNSSLVVAGPFGTVTENADVQIADLGDRLFVPVLLEFETRVPVDLLELLVVNPLQSFLTSYLEASLKGVPVKVGLAPEDQEAQTYQLLASPDTDLLPLINIFE